MSHNNIEYNFYFNIFIRDKIYIEHQQQKISKAEYCDFKIEKEKL